MQDEGHIVGFGGAGPLGRARDVGLERELARWSVGGGDQLDDRDATARGDVEDGRRVAALHEDGARFEVGEVEVELLRAVAGVERRGGGGRGDAEKRGGHRGAVGQDDRDWVLAAESEAVERLAGAGDLGAQSVEGQRVAAGGVDRGPGGIVG